MRPTKTVQGRSDRRTKRMKATSSTSKRKDYGESSTSYKGTPAGQRRPAPRRAKRLARARAEKAMTVTVAKDKSIGHTESTAPDLREGDEVRMGRMGDARAPKHHENDSYPTARRKEKSPASGAAGSCSVSGVYTTPHGSRQLVRNSTTPRPPNQTSFGASRAG